MKMTLKHRFLDAVINGSLGQSDDFGIIVSLKQFKSYFSDVKSDYINSFLPAAVIEIGQYSITHTKYVFRVRKGLYRVHPDVIEEFKSMSYTPEIGLSDFNTKIEESGLLYQSHYIN